MTFQDSSYPRRKNFIKNLNILLDSSPSPPSKKSNILIKPVIKNIS